MNTAARLSTAVLAALVGTGAAAVPAQAAPDPTGRYIVTLQPSLGIGADALDTAAAKLAGAEVEETLPGITGFTANLTARAAARLAANPSVAADEADRIMRVADVDAAATQQSPVWNLDLIDQRTTTRSRTYTPLSSAASVHAYVIDTGIDWTHPDFGGRVTSGFSYDGGTAMDCAGHGTHVAGTIGGGRYGVAKGVKLVGVKVLDCDGEGLLSDVIKGVNWVTGHAIKPAVANMSLGGGASSALDTAVKRSIASGVTYAVAAGNEGQNACNVSPARVGAALTVGAVGGTFTRASFSNYGKCLDLFAPGVGVWSAYPDSRIAQMSGTSMASPHVAGAAAMLLASAPTMTPADVSARLIAYTTKNKVRNAGSNSPNRELFTIAPPAAVKITTSALRAATMGVAYKLQLSRTPGLVGAWSATGLPAGMIVTRGGLVTGTPTGTGTFTVTVRFTDFVPRTVGRTLSLTVN